MCHWQWSEAQREIRNALTAFGPLYSPPGEVPLQTLHCSNTQRRASICVADSSLRRKGQRAQHDLSLATKHSSSSHGWVSWRSEKSRVYLSFTFTGHLKVLHPGISHFRQEACGPKFRRPRCHSPERKRVNFFAFVLLRNEAPYENRRQKEPQFIVHD